MTLRIDPTPEILFGPPGCGKTTSLVDILREELARGVPPDRVGLVTFTRQAANEAMERVITDFPALSKADFPHFRTLHSICMQWAGISTKSVLQGEKLQGFADWIGETITGRQAIDGVWSGYNRGDRLLFMDNLARIRRVPLRKLYEEDHDDLDWDVVDRFSRGMREYKIENRLHDFSDFLEAFAVGDRRPNLEVLLVDEAQDLSLLQWDCVAALARGCRRVVISGDDDQAIFSWAGADADTLIDMSGASRVLDQSYRVPRRVQSVANEIIGRVRHRREKAWRPRDEEGVVRHIRSMEEADFEGASTMILSRNRYALDPVERELRAAGKLYSREGAPSVRRATVEAVVVWERLRRGERQRVADVVAGPYEMMSVGSGVLRGYKKLPRIPPDGLVSLDDLKSHGGLQTDRVWHEALDKMSPENRLYLMKCRRNGERLTQEPKVKLSTIHGAKGGEADRVILMTDIAPRTDRERYQNPDAENRVLYVAVTRARRELWIVAPQTMRSYQL